MTGTRENGRPLRILFFLLHAGYLRHYAEPLRILADRGHDIHLSFTRYEKDAGDAALAWRLVDEYPNITTSIAPARSRRDRWRGIAWLTRGFTDLARYMDPRYDDAPALRERMADRVRGHVLTAKRLDPVSGLICRRIVAWMSCRSDAHSSQKAVRFFGGLDRAVPASRSIKRFIANHRPDVVLVTPLIDMASSQAELIKAAKHLGIRTGVCVASWDNLTGKGLIRTVPDRVIVWNEIQRNEARDLHGIPAERVVLTGAQRFDEWFERRVTTTPEAFRRKVGLDVDRPYLLYLCSSPFIAPDEVAFVRRWATAIRSSPVPALRDVSLLVRPHPQNAAQWRDADLADLGAVSVWPREGQQPDAEEARAAFFDSLAHSAAVVGINTSALIEAGIVGKSVYTVLAPEFKQESTLHFHYLRFENGGFLHTAGSLEEHLGQLLRALDGTTDDSAQTRRFVAGFVRPNGLERPAAPIVADELEAIGRLPRPDPEKRPLWAYAVRLPLSVLATATWVGGLAQAAAWKTRRRGTTAPPTVPGAREAAPPRPERA